MKRYSLFLFCALLFGQSTILNNPYTVKDIRTTAGEGPYFYVGPATIPPGWTFVTAHGYKDTGTVLWFMDTRGSLYRVVGEEKDGVFQITPDAGRIARQ